ncbi:hypothetical protein PV326_009071 [Microctonus aethiopoides]|nr:hypothetical protein PV326_009071 [Microctonus aethiopoides]
MKHECCMNVSGTLQERGVNVAGRLLEGCRKVAGMLQQHSPAMLNMFNIPPIFITSSQINCIQTQMERCGNAAGTMRERCRKVAGTLRERCRKVAGMLQQHSPAMFNML